MTVIGTPSFPGHFVDGDFAERACVVEGRSIDDLSIVGQRVPIDGRRIACRIEALGLLHGHVEGRHRGGGRLFLAEGPVKSARIAARIAWHCLRLDGGAELRSDRRVVPIRPGVSLKGLGWEIDGTLVDVSAGGAALEVVPRPAIGDPVTVGMRRAVVIRHTESGIAIRFVLPLRPEDVTEHVRL